MQIKNITIAGAGTLGAQVAWQAAFKGFDVIVYGPSDKGLNRCRNAHKEFATLFIKTRGASQKEIDAANNRLNYTQDLESAVKNADFINESVPEDIQLKKDFYKKLAELAPERTIFTTNSSTMLPSQYAQETGRPDKFLALHFANEIWEANVAEIMGHADTDPRVFNRVVELAKQIGMVPIPIHKEQHGYVLNSLLMPLLGAAGNLMFSGVADVENIDKTWMIATGARKGPFGIMDMVGMQTMYNVMKIAALKSKKKPLMDRANMIKELFIDQGKMGVSTGEGFYKYPNPRYEAPDFLK
ncbi:MAG: 3-hydroxyacyl-CoA dehydrogenase [Proteobacteria bacterium]|nr:3-hydroxyacyl-CoA dehydrogenase [Pseudomonadota bacterium]MBU1387352.1 3-hydroxyacyl-CoA dehydrogenase [Pseudomonadota bacterium]MBU1541637.1 3-hydroxyacyl-CoA dehydrogenase [Pseudomonadota bacterium]MBU2429171.1 3-hydroxyacyl-CoA dehydrogenase [Pseudomonadota bacterium]MBU2482421.1 3-hydroxyacyl-CoA dehydrogenase [Pseudomonadota bacterium]